MKKIPSLFKRNFETFKIYNEVTEGCEWVQKGEGIATRKYDGTACMIKDGVPYKRYDCKKDKTPPVNGFACQPFRDEVTGHWPWWIPITKNDKYHIEAFDELLPDGTYELCGPKVNGNPEGLLAHTLIPHGIRKYVLCPTTFNEVRHFIENLGIEGIVWHHPDGRMCKIKLRDFGIKRSK